jgi:hypothetical protein
MTGDRSVDRRMEPLQFRLSTDEDPAGQTSEEVRLAGCPGGNCSPRIDAVESGQDVGG